MDQIIAQNAARDQRALVRTITRKQMILFMKAIQRLKKQKQKRVTFADQATDQVVQAEAAEAIEPKTPVKTNKSKVKAIKAKDSKVIEDTKSAERDILASIVSARLEARLSRA